MDNIMNQTVRSTDDDMLGTVINYKTAGFPGTISMIKVRWNDGKIDWHIPGQFQFIR